MFMIKLSIHLRLALGGMKLKQMMIQMSALHPSLLHVVSSIHLHGFPKQLSMNENASLTAEYPEHTDPL